MPQLRTQVDFVIDTNNTAATSLYGFVCPTTDLKVQPITSHLFPIGHGKVWTMMALMAPRLLTPHHTPPHPPLLNTVLSTSNKAKPMIGNLQDFCFVNVSGKVIYEPLPTPINISGHYYYHNKRSSTCMITHWWCNVMDAPSQYLYTLCLDLCMPSSSASLLKGFHHTRYMYGYCTYPILEYRTTNTSLLCT